MEPPARLRVPEDRGYEYQRGPEVLHSESHESRSAAHLLETNQGLVWAGPQHGGLRRLYA